MIILLLMIKPNLAASLNLSFRCVAANWWSLTPGRTTPACMSALVKTWSESGTVTQQSWWCTVSTGWGSRKFCEENSSVSILLFPRRTPGAGTAAGQSGGDGGWHGGLPVRGPWRSRPHCPMAARGRRASPWEVRWRLFAIIVSHEDSWAIRILLGPDFTFS